MSQRFNICISHKPSMSLAEEVKVIEMIIDLFEKYFIKITELLVIEIPYRRIVSLSDRCRLIDALTEIQIDTSRMLFVYGVSETGFTNCISINNSNHAIQIVVSLPFDEVTKTKKEVLQNFWLRIWNSLAVFKISLLAVGDELEFDNCSLTDQLKAFLGSFSLAYWVIASEKLSAELGESFETNAYEALSQNHNCKMFVSKYVEQRLAP